MPEIFVDWLHQPPTLTEPEDEGGWLEEHLSPARLDELFGREWITLTGQSKSSVDRFDDCLRVETCLLTPAGDTSWAPRSNLMTTSLPSHPLVSELLTYRAGDGSDLCEPGVIPLLVESHEPIDRDAELGMLAPEPLAPDAFQLDVGELNLHRHGTSVGRWRWQAENAIFEVPRNTLTDYVRTSGLQVGLLVTTQRQIRVERGKWDVAQSRTRAYAGSWSGEGVPSLAIVEEW